MGLTRCYKTEGFLHLFVLKMQIFRCGNRKLEIWVWWCNEGCCPTFEPSWRHCVHVNVIKCWLNTAY